MKLEEARHLLDLAARYCDTLAAVEQAYMTSDLDSIYSILDGVDPIDIKNLASEIRAFALEFEAAVHGGRTTALTDGSAPAFAVGTSAPVEPQSLDAWRTRCE